MANPRVSVKMTKALTDELTRQMAAGAIDIPRLAESVITADDVTTRYAILTQESSGHVIVYGPYLTPDAANKAIDLGVCATMPGTQAAVYPLNPAPKMPRQRKGAA